MSEVSNTHKFYFKKLQLSSVQRPIRPRTRDMAILAHVSANHGLAIVVIPKNLAQTESRVQIPRLIARAKRATEGDLAPIAVADGPPDTGPLEALEDPPEKHVVALLLGVDAPGPVADVEAVAPESAREKLVPLLPAQVPHL